LKITELAQTFGKRYVLIVTKIGLGYILGDCLTNALGPPLAVRYNRYNGTTLEFQKQNLKKPSDFITNVEEYWRIQGLVVCR
jgi:hypothetical protein